MPFFAGIGSHKPRCRTERAVCSFVAGMADAEEFASGVLRGPASGLAGRGHHLGNDDSDGQLRDDDEAEGPEAPGHTPPRPN